MVVVAEQMEGDRQVRLVAGIHVLPYGDDEVFVRAGSRSSTSVVVRDPDRRRLLVRVVERLGAGPCSPKEVADQLACPVDDVTSLVDQLVESVIAEVVVERARSVVVVVGSGRTAALLEHSLRTDDLVEVQQVESVDDVPDIDDAARARTLVALTTDVRHPGGEQDLSLWAMETDVAILRTCLDGDEALIGPIVVPGQSACLNCFDIQDEATRSFRFDYLAYKRALDRDGGPCSTHRAQLVAAGYAAIAIADRAASGWGFLVERVVHVNTGTLELSTDRVFRVPRCPVCLRHRADLRHTFL